MKNYCVYMMTNKTNKVLYTGVTNDLKRRAFEHRGGLADGFTKRYNCHKLVYYEITDDVNSAIKREKILKGWKRFRKDELVNNFNSEWRDLYDEI